MNKVKILIEGYAVWLGPDKQKACGTITLIQGKKHNCIVDTGNVGDANSIVSALKKEDLTPKDITYVINTHGDIDHVGNNSLFTKATIIGGYDIVNDHDVFTFFDDKYLIEEGVEVVST